MEGVIVATSPTKRKADPANAMICHCTDCQTLSGSAFSTVILTQEDSFKLRSGELKIYVKTGESGTERPQSFCPKCGTLIYSTTFREGPKVHLIRLGTVHQREQIVPRLQLWFRSVQHWVIDLGSIPKIETQPIFSRSGGVSGNA
jgi:hypothetical protein